MQRLNEEFKANETVLEEMRGQVSTYRNDGKIEAAKRYEDQINLLQVVLVVYFLEETGFIIHKKTLDPFRDTPNKTGRIHVSPSRVRVPT